MRLNKTKYKSQSRKLTEAQSLLKNVLDLVITSLPTENQRAKQGESLKNFFRNYYIRPDNEGSLSLRYCQIKYASLSL